MKVYVFPADAYGCGWYRLMHAAYYLKEQGHDVEVIAPGDPRANSLRGSVQNGKTIAVSAPKDADVMVFQRVTHLQLSQGIPLYRARGIAVVIDMDDDLSCIHPKNPAWMGLHPKSQRPHSWVAAQEACDAATLVTVSTTALLQRYATHGRGVVIDNYIPQRYLDIEHQDSAVIGWGGSVSTHPDDLQMTGTAISTLLSEGAEFKVVGSGLDVAPTLRLGGGWANATGIIDIHNWAQALSDNIGIGIAPLADTKFNAAKSRLKMLEYAAVGIPVVASPRAEYTRLAKMGVGLLCDKPKDWERTLRSLINSPSLREELAGKGREIASELTIEKSAYQWWDAWTKAYEIEQSSGLAN